MKLKFKYFQILLVKRKWKRERNCRKEKIERIENEKKEYILMYINIFYFWIYVKISNLFFIIYNDN